MMKPKNFIALFFALLFLTKLVSVDARAYSLLLESSGISLVNKFCEKEKFIDASDQQLLQQAEQQLSLELDFLCHAPVQFSLFEWQPMIAEDNFRKHTYNNPGLIQVYSDRLYPPPRV